MSRALSIAVLCASFLSCPNAMHAAPAAVNETPAKPGEWGFRPADDALSGVNPPALVWRPQSGAATYDVQLARSESFDEVAYDVEALEFHCHTAPQTLEAGRWFWRFRWRDTDGNASAWSMKRSFRVDASSTPFPMPPREQLLARIPAEHPRLFLRPEQLPELRRRARGDQQAIYKALVARCEKLLRDPPPTAEPPKYPPGTVSHSEQWREIWWGNRTYTTGVLNGAATLGFVRLLDGNDDYGALAKRLLMDAAEWDPVGATGYRYNDEAGMPYAYYFARTYTFIHDLLSEEEKAKCREVMTVRGREMYRHLCPRHLWRPYSSHSNRAWHFLGEVGIAFHGEIPEAERWTWFAMNVFYHAYPVWSDDDGGWHEGAAYWSSYIHRFTWWADVMRAAFEIDAYQKPYFAHVGDYPMYLQPPGTVGGGFGDLCARRTSASNRALMTTLAAQARNPYWQWYVEQHGGPAQANDYVTFVRGMLPEVAPQTPAELPSSRCFHGTGQAYLNGDVTDGRNNVAVMLKSSPFGTQSHGYESQNSLLLYAFGERLLIRTGLRDIYGSDHHRNWMWHTRSTNCITVDGAGQQKHSAAAVGEILAFHTSPTLDFVAGEAGQAYGDLLERFTRSVVFVKPDLVVVLDRLRAPQPATFQWHLHAPVPFTVGDQRNIAVQGKQAACDVAMLAPNDLKIDVTDRFDPPPRPRVKLTEWHLTASTPAPQHQAAFVTAMLPHRVGQPPEISLKLHDIADGHALTAERDGRRVVMLLRTDEGRTLEFGKYESADDVAVFIEDVAGELTSGLRCKRRSVEAIGGKTSPNR